MPLLLAVLLSTAPVSLASPDFTTANVSPEVARFCNEHLAQQFAAHGVQVITARQISAMLGLERQRQMLGCAEEASNCMAELANALGAEGLVLGDLGRLGAKYQLNVRVMRALNGQTLASWSRTVSREDDLLEALADAATALAPEVKRALRPEPAESAATQVKPVPRPEAPVAAPTVVRHWPWIPTGIAGGLAVAGAISFGIAAAANGALRDTSQPPGSLDGPATAERGEWAQRISFGAFIGAAAALAVAVVWYFATGTEAPAHAFIPGSGGGLFALGWPL